MTKYPDVWLYMYYLFVESGQNVIVAPKTQGAAYPPSNQQLILSIVGST